jgi:hypothetical protein
MGFTGTPCNRKVKGVSLGLTLKELTMANSNSVQFQQVPAISIKPLIAIKDIFVLLADAFSEAKVLEQKSRRTSGNW